MTERLTDRGIAALKPVEKSLILFDSEVSGLCLRVYPSGRKVFCFDWRDGVGRQRRVTLGRHPVWTVGKARLEASRMRLKADTGETVATKKGERVAALLTAWQANVAVTKRASTIKAYTRLTAIYILPSFGKLEPRAVSRNLVSQWHGEIAQVTPVEANRALAVLSSFMSWLEHDHKIERNPCKGVDHRPETARTVFLDADEIAAAHAALDRSGDRQSALALKLTLMTGCRIGEVLGLQSSQIDAGRRVWVKPSSHTKQKKLHITPMSAEAVAVAQQLLQLGPPNYDGVRATWRKVKTLLNRPDVRIHDLRHSRASSLARNGASLPQIGALLGHANPATTARYAHLLSADLVDLVERTS